MPDACLLPPLRDRPDDRRALCVAGRALTYRELANAAAAVAATVGDTERVAVWAQPTLETCVAVIGALEAGATVVPINPGNGLRELEHVVADSAPALLFADAAEELPAVLDGIPRAAVDLAPPATDLPPAVAPSRPAFVLYTSGTTGPPKGAMISHRAVAANLDALAEVWHWSGDDRLAHALPLFHVHGLILGILGPLRRGGQAEHVGRFTPSALAEAVRGGATMVFGVPTMYQRIVRDSAADPAIGTAFAGARLLVSGSAALPAVVREGMERLAGRRVIERYGLTETLIDTAVPLDEPDAALTVGRPLPGVELRLLDDDGRAIDPQDTETIGEIVVRGPSLFDGYLNRPDATAAALRDGWFHTGDLATRDARGLIRIVGRRATDLIKSGGFKIGAGEIESALLEHPAVAEAAVAGRPDDDLGEHVTAWVVRADGATVSAEELSLHVGELLAFYKRPRQVHFVDALPRNPLGKVVKQALQP